MISPIANILQCKKKYAIVWVTMNAPDPDDNKRKAHLNVDEGEHKVIDSIASTHPEWKDENGECDSCVSLAHELADPSHLPKEIEDEVK